MTKSLLRHTARRIAAVLGVASLVVIPGCGGGTPGSAGATATPQPPTATSPVDQGGHRGGRGSAGGARVTAALPSDWPADVPAPPGSIQGSAHANSTTWTVQTLASGSAQAVMSQTVASYRAAGFVAETDAILHNATHRVTIVVENRDHSNAETFVVMSVTGR
jgi:hypothetical protein